MPPGRGLAALCGVIASLLVHGVSPQAHAGTQPTEGPEDQRMPILDQVAGHHMAARRSDGLIGARL